jgi:hypothetical protein
MYLYIRTIELALMAISIAIVVITHMILLFVGTMSEYQTQVHAYLNIGASALLIILLFRGTYFVARGYA